MRRIIACIALVGLVLLSGAESTSADVLWCKTDPLILVDGSIIDLSTSMPLQYVPLVNGPVRYEIKILRSVSRKVLLNDLGFNLQGSEVIFTDGYGTVKDGEVPMAIRVTVPLDTSRLEPGQTVPAELTLIADNLTIMSVQGTTDKITAEAKIKGLLPSLLN